MTNLQINLSGSRTAKWRSPSYLSSRFLVNSINKSGMQTVHYVSKMKRGIIRKSTINNCTLYVKYRWKKFGDDVYIHLYTISQCDGRTDRQTDINDISRSRVNCQRAIKNTASENFILIYTSWSYSDRNLKLLGWILINAVSCSFLYRLKTASGACV